MTDGNRKCIVCGKEYKFCGHCSDQYRKNETWRNIYCSERCMNIFNVISMFVNNHINKEQAKEMLSKSEVENTKTFRKDIQDQIDIIMKQENRVFEQKTIQPQKPKDIVKDDSKKK